MRLCIQVQTNGVPFPNATYTRNHVTQSTMHVGKCFSQFKEQPMNNILKTPESLPNILSANKTCILSSVYRILHVKRASIKRTTRHRVEFRFRRLIFIMELDQWNQTNGTRPMKLDQWNYTNGTRPMELDQWNQTNGTRHYLTVTFIQACNRLCPMQI